MKNIILSKKSKTVNGTIQLTGSKSECNRALILEALSEGIVDVKNVSDAADAVTLSRILKSEVGMPNAEYTINPHSTIRTLHLINFRN